MDARVYARMGAIAIGLIAISHPHAVAARVATKNFVVDAPTADTAQVVARRAEELRKVIARAWLRRELPDWPAPCPVQVRITHGEAGGVTNFDFGEKRVKYQEIKVEGRLDRILESALPHEITHTIFAAYFGGPMPRWADEGASLLSEDLRELRRHDQIALDLLRRRAELPLARLFQMAEYPADLMGFYGQGYSVSRFLVEIGGRPRFLAFVKEGMAAGWDQAARAHYGLGDCRELDRAWHAWHKVTLVDGRPSQPPLILRAQNPEEEVPDDEPVQRRAARPVEDRSAALTTPRRSREYASAAY